MLRHFYSVLVLLCLFSVSAHAACTSPDGAESQTRYDFGAHKMYYCNNSSWVEMGADAALPSCPDPAQQLVIVGSKMECRFSSCTLDGVTLAHGQSQYFYSASSVPCGSSCTGVRASRTCNNGTMTGNASFNLASCTPAACMPVCGAWTDDECRSDIIATATGKNASTCIAFCQSTPGTTCCRREGSNCWAHTGGRSGDSNEPSEYAASCSTPSP